MGFLGADYEVDRYTSELDQAKKRKEWAKQSGIYKTAGKNFVLPDGRRVNEYDSEIFHANMRLKNAKEKLAKEKAENKSKSSSSKSSSSKSSSSSSRTSSSSSSSSRSSDSSGKEAFAAVAQKAAQDMKLQMEIESKVSTYYKSLDEKYVIKDASEVTLLTWMMELRDESVRLKKEMNASDGDEPDYSIAKKCKNLADEYYDKAYSKIIKINVERQVTAIKKQYPVETASDTELVKMLPGLLAELKKQEQTRSNGKDDKIAYDIACGCYSEVRSYATNACLRLKKLNPELFKQPEVMDVAKQINPTLGNAVGGTLMSMLFNPMSWFSGLLDKIKSSLDL